MSTIHFSTALEQSYYNTLRPNEQTEYLTLSTRDKARAFTQYANFNKGYRKSAKRGTLSPEALKELERSNKAAAILYAGIKPVIQETVSSPIIFKRINSEESIEPINLGVTSSTTDSEGEAEVAYETTKPNLLSRITTAFAKKEMDIQDNETTGYGFAMHRPDLLPK